MKIAPLGVEQWMSEYETRCTFNLAGTCVDSLTVAQLLELTGRDRGRVRLPILAITGRAGGAPGIMRPRTRYGQGGSG